MLFRGVVAAGVHSTRHWRVLDQSLSSLGGAPSNTRVRSMIDYSAFALVRSALHTICCAPVSFDRCGGAPSFSSTPYPLRTELSQHVVLRPLLCVQPSVSRLRSVVLESRRRGLPALPRLRRAWERRTSQASFDASHAARGLCGGSGCACGAPSGHEWGAETKAMATRRRRCAFHARLRYGVSPPRRRLTAAPPRLFDGGS